MTEPHDTNPERALDDVRSTRGNRIAGERLAEQRLLDHLMTSLGAPIGALLEDPHVTEIRLNPDGRIWKTALGRGRLDTGETMGVHDARAVLDIVAHAVNKAQHETSFPAELPGSGFRFHGVLPPQVPRPVFVIRKKPARVFTLSEYVNSNIMTQAQHDAIVAAVHARQNMLIVGGTDSGKTTLANAVLDVMSKTGDRIITIEDTLELICLAEEYVPLRTVRGIRTMQDLVRDCLRMTPDRIIVGEVRGPEVIDMLGGWNTGHPGGLATIHANSGYDALERVEDLIRQGGVTPVPRTIAKAIDLIIYIEQVTEIVAGEKTRRRKISEILTVEGVKGDEYLLEPVL